MTRKEIENAAEEYANSLQTLTGPEKALTALAFNDGGLFVMKKLNEQIEELITEDCYDGEIEMEYDEPEEYE